MEGDGANADGTDGLFGSGDYTNGSGDSYHGKFDPYALTGTGTIDFADGSTYSGDILDGMMHGRGTLKTRDSVYSGEFFNGKCRGQGTLEVSGEDGFLYTGEFLDGRPCGQGRYEMPDGSRYTGVFESGSVSGEDITVENPQKGERYTGSVSNGMYDGKGRLERRGAREGEGPRVIEAEWVMGIICSGKGPGTWDGDDYDGEWRDSMPNGQGTLRTERSGVEVVYTGKFLNGSFHGRGVMEGTADDGHPVRLDGEWRYGMFWSGKDCSGYTDDGSYFEGAWDDGYPSEGRLVSSDGDVYTGKFRNGLMECDSGHVEWADGGEWTGSWEGGRPMDGTGISYGDGWTFDGTLHLGKPVGNGTMSYDTGITVKGRYLDGELQDGEKATVTYEDGSEYVGGLNGLRKEGEGVLKFTEDTRHYVYRGNFVNGFRHGYGRLYRVRGRREHIIYDGEWKDDMRHGKGTSRARGYTYTGEWICDRRNGPGIECGPNMSKRSGEWADGELVSRGLSKDDKRREGGGRIARKDPFWTKHRAAPSYWALFSVAVPGIGQFIRGSKIAGVILFLLFAGLVAAGLLEYDNGFLGINLIIAAMVVYVVVFLEASFYARTGRRIF